MSEITKGLLSIFKKVGVRDTSFYMSANRQDVVLDFAPPKSWEVIHDTVGAKQGEHVVLGFGVGDKNIVITARVLDAKGEHLRVWAKNVKKKGFFHNSFVRGLGLFSLSKVENLKRSDPFEGPQDQDPLYGLDKK